MNAVNFITKYKMWLIIIVTVIVIAVIIYFVGKKKGKEYKKVALPEDTMKNLTSNESEIIEHLANALYKDMKGLNFTRDMATWDEYLATSERVFLGTYNYFNQKFGNGETLYQWLKDESFFEMLRNPFNSLWYSTRKRVLERMEANKDISKQI